MRRVRTTLLAIGIAALTVGAFFPSLDGQFLNWDDEKNLVTNEGYRGLGASQLRWMATTTLMGHWIPLTWVTLGLNYVVGGMAPWGYHAGNLLLHAANAVVCFVVARRLLAAGAGEARTAARVEWGAAVAAAVFAVHPLRVESVAWATERRDVLSGLFFLLAVWGYLRAVEQGRQGGLDGRWRAVSLGLFAAALMSKASTMMLPAALLVLDVYPLRRRRQGVGWGALVREKLGYLVLAGAGAVVALVAVRQGALVTGYGEYGVGARAVMTVYSLFFYPWKFLWPVDLSPMYELPARIEPVAWKFVVPLVAVPVITVALLALRRRWPGGLAAWVYSALLVLPVSGAVHAGYQLAHDRYSYLSGLGLAVLVGGVVVGVLGGGGAGSGAAVGDGGGAGDGGAGGGGAGGGDVAAEPGVARLRDSLALGGERRSRVRALPTTTWSRRWSWRTSDQHWLRSPGRESFPLRDLAATATAGRVLQQPGGRSGDARPLRRSRERPSRPTSSSHLLETRSLRRGLGSSTSTRGVTRMRFRSCGARWLSIRAFRSCATTWSWRSASARTSSRSEATKQEAAALRREASELVSARAGGTAGR